MEDMSIFLRGADLEVIFFELGRDSKSDALDYRTFLDALTGSLLSDTKSGKK